MSTVDREMLAGPTRGSVDLVAIERVRAGQPAELSDADREYLLDHLDGSNEESRLIGQALGLSAKALQRVYHRRRHAPPS